MSLVRKRQTTEKGTAARRANGRKGRGPATEAGNAQSARSNLRHGFFSQRVDGPIAEFGESTKDYTRLLNSLIDDLQPRPGLQSELVLRMRRTLWRMRRADRMRDGAALRRVQAGLRLQDFALAPKLIQTHGFYEQLIALWNALKLPDYVPSIEDMDALAKACGNPSTEGLKEFFPLVGALREAALKAPGSSNPCNGPEPEPPTPEGQQRHEAYRKLVGALDKLMHHYRAVLDMVLAESEKIRSPENIASLMEGRDDDSVLMQRVGDSNMRELWRITRLFLMLKRHTRSDEEELDNNTAEGGYIEEKEDS